MMIVVLVLAAAAPWSRAVAAEGPLAREYFIRQGVDEALLIRVDGVDAVFSATVEDIDGVIVTDGGITEQRLGPLFLYVPETSRDRQLDIRVIASQHTGRTRFDMGLNRVGVRDQRSATLDRAYRQLAYGLQPPGVDTAANWSVKAGSLSSAAQTFAGFGMDELRLWAGFFQAHITAIGMADAATALLLLTELQADDSLSRFPDIALALAWLRLRLASPDRDPGAALEAAGAVLAQPAVTGQPLVQAEARFAQAEALVALDRPGEGMDQYQAALDQADRIGAVELSTTVRERLVELHGQAGDAIATGEVLREIESRLVADGQGDELARNLLAQGRLLNDTWRYSESRQVLEQALSLARDSATRAQVALELARAALATGDFESALAQAEAAARNPGEAGWRRQTPLLDVALALGIVADVQRHNADYSAMREARAAQGERVGDGDARSALDYARVLDALAAPGARLAADAPLRDLVARGNTPWAALARLQQCRLAAGCDPATTRTALDQARADGRPGIALEAALLHADWLAAVGQDAAALQSREALVGEVAQLQASQRGVIGRWYWQRQDALFEGFVNSLMTAATPDRARVGLLQVRRLVDASALGAGSDVDTPPGDLRDGPAAWTGSMGESTAVLDFHVGQNGAWLLYTDRTGTRRFRLEAGAALATDLAALANRLPTLETAAFDRELDRIGRRLLAPVAGELPRRLYWVGAGALARIPVAALRLNGRYLAEDHVISSPLAFPPVTPPTTAASPGDGMFLAGAPESFQPGYLATLSPAPELDAVASMFVGPGLEVVRGSALLADEFTTQAFQEAGRVHLAMPAAINWSRPGESWMELSEPTGGGGRERVSPADITAWRTRAATLFMGQTVMTGDVTSAFALRPPLVGQWLDAGALAVPVTLWAGEPGPSVAFVEAFYGALDDDPDPAMSLATAMRAAIATGVAPREWARYRLYTR